MEDYQKTVEAVLEEQKVTAQGLSEEEAARRLAAHGPNQLAQAPKESLLHRFFRQLADPMTIILIAAALVSGVTAAYAGESFADTVIIAAVVLINAVLGVVQESKAEQAIEALNQIAAATCKVVRQGQQKVIHSSQLAPGDVILLEAGDAVPADARLMECASLKVEEAALTGESVPVDKHSRAIEGADSVPLGDRANMVYMGCTVAYGRGKAVVTQTGMGTQVGKIAGALLAAKEEKTPLQKKLAQLSRILTWLVLGVCGVIFAVDILRAWPNLGGGFLIDTFMVAVSLAVAAIPEGLATVVTIVLSIGVTNMSKRNAIIRRMTAVETLGCAQVICSDKTGTLTQNRMKVVERRAQDEKLLARAMALCSDARMGPEGAAVGEPTECALVEDALALGLDKEQMERETPRVGEAPFDSMRKMMTTLHKTGQGVTQYTKGAPDEVLARCTHAWVGGQAVPMTQAMRQEALEHNGAMAGKALRVLAAATRAYPALPEDQSPQALERELCFLGLSGMMDPVRPEVKAAMEKCRQAGIRPVMITGDHRDTAVAIAKELGIIQDASQAIAGAELDKLTDAQLEAHIQDLGVYARVQPEHKVRIVNAWKKKGKITAMTGDGVNDAPSIKSADIGVGMGLTGTDVTKNVADMVLADDNFATIVAAVEEGRRIYDNIRKAIQFLLASNLSEVLAVFSATLMGFTILRPVHLLWINLITDCLPALALGVEKGEPDLMRRPPRDPAQGIFAGGVGFDVVFQGAVVTAITLLSYALGHYMEAGAWAMVNSADGMTMAFLTLSMIEIFHAFNMRSLRESVFRLPSHNRLLWAAMGLSMALTLAVIYVPLLSSAFGFAHISLAEYLTAMGLAISIIPIVELEKWLKRRKGRAR